MTKPRTPRRKPSAASPASDPPPPSPPPAAPRRPVPRDATPGRHRLIRASAGTGKTYQLSGRFIDRLRTSEPEQILATTFTRAAAGEILDRVLLRLAEAVFDKQKRVALSQQVTLPEGEQLAEADCLRLLESLTRQLHRVRVGTLDSFFIQLAQSFALELGLPPGWRILEPIEAEQILTQAIERLLHKRDAGEIGPLLNLLSRGDAGRSVVRELRRAARDFYDVYRSTTAPAWNRVPEPVPFSADELRTALELLEFARQHLPDKPTWRDAHDKSIVAAWDGEWEEFLTSGIGKVLVEGGNAYRQGPIPPPLAAAYEGLVPHARAVLVRELASRNSVTFELLDRLHAEIRSLKHEQQGLTFADVTRALGEGWQQGALARLDYRLDSTIEHLLLDEFQDTSVPQWQALEPLARRVTAAAHTSLFCVGDQKQAIFGWRGGVAELFDAVQQRLEGVSDEPLARSFRSSPAVIEAVNRFGANLLNHPALERARSAVVNWQSRFDAHETAKTELPGWVTLEAAAEASFDSTYEHTARRVAEVHAQSPRTTIGVLAKTNEAVAQLARLIRGYGIEVSEEGHSQLGDNVAVQVISSLLHLADHPGDTAARFHVATSPLGPVVGATDPTPPVPDSGASGTGDATECEQFWDQFAVGVRRDLLERGYGACLEEWARVLAPHCDPRGVSRLRQLVDLAHDYAQYATLRPSDFVEYLASHAALQPATARVRVMTVHHSKGLEFDVVFLPELNQKTLTRPPDFVTGHPSPVDEPDSVVRYASEFLQSLLPPELQAVFQSNYERKVEEALCVLYVAITRARHALHLVVFPAAGKATSRNMATLLRTSLTNGAPLAPGAVVTISGDPQWWRQLPQEPTLNSPATAYASPLSFALAPAVESVLDREGVRPSQHGRRQMRLLELLRPANAAALSRGTLVHAWCEQIAWLEDGPPDEARLRRVAHRLGLTDVQLETTLREFLQMLVAPAVTRAISRAAYQSPNGVLSQLTIAARGKLQLSVKHERRFLAPVDERLVNGCIDRLVLIQEGGRVLAADILDFKTDVLELVSRETARDRRAGYHEQLQLYRRAVSHLYNLPIERIGARLVWLATGEVEEVAGVQ